MIGVQTRRAARELAQVPLRKRLEACQSFGVHRELDADPIGAVVRGARTPDGVDVIVQTVPIGVVGLSSADHDQIADCLIAGNAVVVAGAQPQVAEISHALAKNGLPPDAIVSVPHLPSTELDAVSHEGEWFFAQREGGHTHVYIDAHADRHFAIYLAVNAISHKAADSLVVHKDFARDTLDDIRQVMDNLHENPEIIVADSDSEAIDILDSRSNGTVETIVSSNIKVVHSMSRAIDAAVIAANVSPAFATIDMQERQLVGYTRTRTTLIGDGHTKSLDDLALQGDRGIAGSM